MKTVLGLLLVLTLSTVVWAQGDGDGPDCYQVTIYGTDTGCTFPQECNSTTGCTSVTFTPSCTGRFTFDVWTECSGESGCKHCRACAMVYKNGQQVGENCHAANCDLADCDFTCAVDLSAGIEYQLYVCLNACPNENCAHCGADCTAHACLRLSQASPCY